MLVVIVVTACLSLSGDGAASPQEPDVIAGAASCAECRIVVERTATLGGGTESEGLVCQYWTRVVTDSRGLFYVAPSCTPGTIDVYAPDGSLSRTIGRLGQGPGEFGHILQVFIGEDDYLYVFDTGGRLTIVAPDGSEHSRFAINMKPPDAFAAGSVGAPFVVHTQVRRPDSAGRPLHVVEADGSLGRSFGATPTSANPDGWQQFWRMVAMDGNGRVWSSSARPDYRLEQWDVGSGAQLASYRREVDWYDAEATAGPLVHGLSRREDGTLWSLVVVAPGGWEWGDQTRTPEQINQGRFSVLEVIDPDRNALLAQYRTDVVFERFIGHDSMYSFRGLPDGNIVIDIWRFELIEPGSRD